MQYLRGASAFTAFRLNKLLNNLKFISPSVSAVEACYVFFADVEGALNEHQAQQLSTLLRHSDFQSLPNAQTDLSFWVVPRIGTISPWSSKATDILHICGLQQVRRVERGIFYSLPGVAIEALSPIQITSILAACHDPLIESVILPEDNLQVLFNYSAPQPVMAIDVSTRGIAALVEINDRLGLALSQSELAYLLRA